MQIAERWNGPPSSAVSLTDGFRCWRQRSDARKMAIPGAERFRQQASWRAEWTPVTAASDVMGTGDVELILPSLDHAIGSLP